MVELVDVGHLLNPLFQKALEIPPSQFIVGNKKEGANAGDDLDDDAQICSCHVSSRIIGFDV